MTKLPAAVESAIALLDTEIVPRGAGAYVTLYGVEELRTAIAAAIEAEREACVVACLKAADECPGTEDEVATWREAVMWCVGAIRARGNES